MAKLLYQGHASLRITADNGKVIYIDPFAGAGYEKPADIILITHRHFDHSIIKKVTQKKECEIITEKEALENGVYNNFNISGIKIETVEAANKNHDIKECAGYILTVDNIQIYISGDTSKTKQMETFKARNLDYALLCCDGVYNMDLKEAAECADIINAKHSIPIHIVPASSGKLFDKTRAEKFEAKNKLIWEPGQEFTL